MILAVAIPENRELVICAAGSLREQKDFLAKIGDESPELIQDTDCTRFVVENDLANFKYEPTILEFPTTAELDAFVAENSIELTNFPNAHGRQRKMLELEEFTDVPSGVTLGELYGLDKNDPWDRRTDEEKAEAEERRKKMQEARKSGDITGDSWGGGGGTKGGAKDKNDPTATGAATGGDIDPAAEKQEGGLKIRDIRIKINDDGTFEADVLADKDLFSPDMYHLSIIDENGNRSKTLEDYTTILKAAGLGDTGRYMGADFEAHEDGGIIIELGGAATVRMKEALAASGREYTLTAMIEEKEGYDASNPYKIANDQLVGVYFRLDVADHDFAHVSALIAADPLGKMPYRQRDMEDGGCWLAYVRRADAEQGETILTKAGVSVKLAEVDHLGARIIEEGAGATVVDTGARQVEPPAPWNDQADEFYALDEKEREKAMKKLLPFLLYSMRDHGIPHRIIVHITPKTYFNKHQKLWDGDLPLDGILPENFIKFGEKVGVYQVKSLDMNTADFLLGNKARMKESLALRAHLNVLGDDAT